MSNTDLTRYSQRIVQYFWDPIPKNDTSAETPIWCLGKQYESRKHSNALSDRQSNVPNSPPAQPPVTLISKTPSALAVNAASGSEDHLAYGSLSSPLDDGRAWPCPFLDDFEAKIWLTYRSNFPPIPKSPDSKAGASMSFSVRLKSHLGSQVGFTSDSGWGCMIRSGQSLLANALLILRLGREWRRGFRAEEERRLLTLFADDPRAPFSIHKFVHHGASACGKHPGEWFGPSATASCIKALSNECTAACLRVHVAGDGSDIYEDAFYADAKGSGDTFHPTLLLLGIRLGIDRVTPVYWESLKHSLQLPQSVGIAGGRPSSSHYFVGTQGDNLFYLDPHQTRPAFPLLDSVDEYSEDEVNSCHTRRLRRIHLREMDPSMLVAFLIRDENDWRIWRRAVTNTPGKAIIHIADRGPPLHGQGVERDSAIDEVETFDDEDE